MINRIIPFGVLRRNKLSNEASQSLSLAPSYFWLSPVFTIRYDPFLLEVNIRMLYPIFAGESAIFTLHRSDI